MKITLAQSAGFCFGVKRALSLALATAASSKGKDVSVLGDIVHNEEVTRAINRAGVKKITRLASRPKGILLIRAHGAPLETFKKAKRCGYKIVDATCPMVKEIHKIAVSMEKKGHRIIIIGDKHHEEVRGIAGQLKTKAVIIDPGTKCLPKPSLAGKKIAVVVQSTQNLEKVLPIVEKIKTLCKKLKFFNTICRPTRIKQEEIKLMPCASDVMIVIGSKASANTKRLYEISKSLNKNTHWINEKTQIRGVWFKEAQSVGISAGASTPETTIKEVIGYIRRVSPTKAGLS